MLSGGQVLFLLGGYDLEMITIRDLLVHHGFRQVFSENFRKERKGFADKQLKWGAIVTAYQAYLDFPGKIYGIELIEPIGWKKPPNYYRIDHHNELSDRPASIEQVAEILEIRLNRWQRLVAANDKGYIRAMRAMGANEEEIQEIRKQDRRAQGVTKKDEDLARESIKKNLRQENGIFVIQSLTKKFSPITDFLYGKTNKLLIYTDHELVYYGIGAAKLAEYFDDLVKFGNAFWGGGANGFFGFADEKANIIDMKSKIIKIISGMQHYE